jgi:signal-transduction protein with cAMP-binding, CBS, and nucleotidyltransferase domain
MRCPNCGLDNLPGNDLCEVCGTDLAGLDLLESRDDFKGQLLTDRIDALGMGPAICLPGEATVRDAVEILREARHGCVLIQDGGLLEGIFTERDLLTRVLGAGLDPAETALHDVMTPDPFVLGPADPPAFAIHRMVSQGLRHLPVLRGDDLVGFVSVRNVLKYIHEDVIGK